MDQTENIPKGNPFRVPENYFSDLNQRILDAALKEKQETARPVKVFNLRRTLAIAASVTIIIGIGISTLLFTPRGINSKDLSELNIYTDSYFNGIDLLTLEESVSGSGSFLETPRVSNSDLIDYLVLEDINENDIIEKL